MPQQPVPQGNCPPGLEYLTMVDQLLVHQKVELLEGWYLTKPCWCEINKNDFITAFTGFETANKYSVKNSMGQKVYAAAEVSDCCTRQCCGPLRAFDMKIVDNLGQEVIHLNRPLACTACCFPCCLQRMDVTSPPGTLIGSIEQEWSILSPKFSIKNATGETVLTMEGPICTFSICGDVDFQVRNCSFEIKKSWLTEFFYSFDRFIPKAAAPKSAKYRNSGVDSFAKLLLMPTCLALIFQWIWTSKWKQFSLELVS